MGRGLLSLPNNSILPNHWGQIRPKLVRGAISSATYLCNARSASSAVHSTSAQALRILLLAEETVLERQKREKKKRKQKRKKEKLEKKKKKSWGREERFARAAALQKLCAVSALHSAQRLSSSACNWKAKLSKEAPYKHRTAQDIVTELQQSSFQ